MNDIEQLEKHIKWAESEYVGFFNAAAKFYQEGDQENHKIWYAKMLKKERQLGHMYSNFMDLKRWRK
jgi:hypothetical protein